MKKLLLGLTIFVFLWGVALRAPEVISGNYVFGFDQGRDYLAAYNIVENHKATLIGSEVGAGAAGISGLFHGPGYYYLIAFSYLIFGGDPYGGLLLMFVFGVATLVVTYSTTKKMFGQTVAALSLLLVGISPLIASQSRFLWNHHPTSFFVVLVLFFAYNITKNPGLFAPIAIFTASFIYHFELAIAVPLVIALFISLPLVFRMKDAKTYLFSLASAVFGFLPFFMFEARHGWMAIRSLLTYMGNNNIPLASDVPYLRFTDHLRYYLANARNSFPTEHTFLPEWSYTALSIGLFIATIFFSFRIKDVAKRRFFQFLLLMLLVSYSVFYFLNNAIWDYYLIHAHVAYIYVFAFYFIGLFRTVRSSVLAKAGVGFMGIFLASMLFSSAGRIMRNYRYDFYDLGGVEKIKGKKIAIDYVYQDASGKPFSEFTFMAPIYTYPYEYLFQTYGKEKYGYVPGNEKKGLVYLIIEPDNSKPWTYKGWLETVIVDGDVVETKTLHTGHIIQKRVFPL